VNMNKIRKINKNLYPSKWNELIEKYNNEDAIELYYKFSRSFCLEKYILKYGEEDGKRIFIDKKSKIDRGMSIEKCIKKYGEEEGIKKYNTWKNSIVQNEESYIRKYGQEEGIKKFKEFSKKCGDLLSMHQKTMPRTTRLDYWIKKCNGNEEEAKEKLNERQNVCSLDRYIKRLGEKDGLKKYQENNLKKAQNLDNLVKKYGDSKGLQKFYEWKEKLKYAHSLQGHIDRYGEEDGKKKYLEITAFHNKMLYDSRFVPRKKGYSLISLCLFNKIVRKIETKFEKIYFGEDEWFFSIHDGVDNVFYIDFYIKDINFGIEFYGDYWHRNEKKYNDEISIQIREKNKKRIDKIVKKFKTHIEIVWESQYRDNPDKMVNEMVDKILKARESYYEKNRPI